jgi:hypothetical protein
MLNHSLTSPIVLSDQPTQLVLLWSIADLPTFWKVRMESATDDALMEVWTTLASDLVSRTREILISGALAPETDPEGDLDTSK